MRYKHFIFTIAASLLTLPCLAEVPYTLVEVMNYQRISNDTATGGALYTYAPEKLKAAGFKTVIDMRTNREANGTEQSIIEAQGISFQQFMTTGHDTMNPDHVRKFSELYQSVEKPVLVHCGTSARIGTLWTHKMILEGAPVVDALETGRKIGMRPDQESALRQKLGF